MQIKPPLHRRNKILDRLTICVVASQLGEASIDETEPFGNNLDGSSRITHELATNLVELGHNVVAITDCPTSNLPYLKRDYETRTVGSRFSLRNIPRFRKLIRELKPDIIHFHGGQPMNAYARLCKFLEKVPMFFTFTYIPSIARESQPFPVRLTSQFLSRFASAKNFRLGNISHIIALTQFSRDKLILDNRIQPDKISVIPYGLPKNSLNNDCKSGDSNTVICISGTTEARGFGTFVKSVSLVRSEFPLTDFSIAIRNRQQLEFLKTNNRNDLKIIGPGNLIDSVSGHSIIVMPFSAHVAVDPPLSLLECMAWRKRVVSTGVGSIPEILSAERGLVVPAKNPAALAKGIIRFLKDVSWGARLSNNARMFVKKTYDWDIALASIMTIYSQQIPNRK